MTTVLADAHLANPVLTASGCAGTGKDLHRFLPLADIGAVVTRSVTRDHREPSPAAAVVETASGLLYPTETPNPGIDRFLATELPWLLQVEARPIVSIAGATLEEYAELARRVGNTPGVVGIEVNLATVVAHDVTSASRVASVVRREAARGVPVFAKVSAASDLADLAHTLVDSGADGLTVTAPQEGLSIDVPAMAASDGRLAGPAVLPLALHAVREAAGAVPGVPVIGVGGVRTGTDALRMLVAGAHAVQVGSAAFSDPEAPARVLNELQAELGTHGFARAAQAVGRLGKGN